MANRDGVEFLRLGLQMGINKPIAAATLTALSVVLLSGCTGVLEAAYVARDMKKTSDEYEQEKQEERVDKLNKDYEEFLTSQGKVGGEDETSDQPIVIIKDDKDADPPPQ